MKNRITLFDYNADWALKEGYLDPKPVPGFMTREEIIDLYGSLGVDGIEIREDYWGDCSTAYLKEITGDRGLAINSYVFTVDLSLPTANQRKAAVDQVRQLLDRTADLGAKIAMIFPGEIKDGIAVRQLRDWMVEGLSQCADHAKKNGITLALENIDYPPWRPIHGTSNQCVDICQAVDSSALRLICDVCAALFVEEDPIRLLRTMSPYVVHVHLKNSREPMVGERVLRTRETIGGRILTGTVLDGGLVAIPAILDELKTINYQGCLLIEYQGENDPRSALPYNIEYLKRQMKDR
jgi:sugar phosphate isomerase/epimerase